MINSKPDRNQSKQTVCSGRSRQKLSEVNRSCQCSTKRQIRKTSQKCELVDSRLFPKLYIPSTLNIDLIMWHTQLIVCAENVKSWFKSLVFPFTFQAYLLHHTLNCMCVSLFKSYKDLFIKNRSKHSSDTLLNLL